MMLVVVVVQAAYRHVDTVRLVEWLEFQRLLGVTQVGVYMLSDLSTSARHVFEYYSSVEGLVDLRHTDLISRVPGGAETSGDQFWLHLTPVINDCIYRNMFRFQRIGVMDFDEVRLPTAGRQTSRRRQGPYGRVAAILSVCYTTV